MYTEYVGISRLMTSRLSLPSINITSKTPSVTMCSLGTRLLSSATKILYRSGAYTCRILEPAKISQRRASLSTDKCLEKTSEEKSSESEDNDEHNLPGALRQEFRTFRDGDATIIFDVDEEKRKMIDLEMINALQEDHDPFAGLNMEHGVRGVFDIEDLVELLRRDKAKNIFVASVPPEFSYVDYMVVVSARSTRHMSALATFVRKVYKKKMRGKGTIPKIEGAESKDWMALDLGNIALHIFSENARVVYDLETLWTVGSKYDSLINRVDPEEAFADKYKQFLDGLQPADAP